MKKRMLHTIFAWTLALLLTLLPGMSLAAEAEFGALTARAMGAAWNAGREITARLYLKMSEMTDASMDDEEAQVIAAVGQMLDAAAISVSAVKTADGMRVALGAELADTRVIDAAVEIGAEKIAVETSVLPGQRLTVGVDELMQLAQMQMPSEEEMNAMIEAVSAYAQGALVRYGAVILPWLDGIEMMEGKGTAATETCDAIARTETYTVTGAQIRELAAALLDAASADTELIAFVESLGMTDDDGNPVDLAAMLAQAKAELAEEDDIDQAKMSIVVGYGEAQEVVSFSVLFTVEDGADEAASMVMTAAQKTEADGTTVVSVNMSAGEGEEDIIRYDFTVATALPAAGETHTSVSGTMYVEEDGMANSMDVAAEGVTQIGETSENAHVQENVHMTSTKDGNEASTVNMSLLMDMKTDVQNEDFTTTLAYDAEMGMSAEADEESAAVDMSMKYGMGMDIQSAAYVPSTEEVTEVDVLALDEEGMNALLTQAQTGLTQAMFTAISLLPPDALALMMAE